MANLLVKDGGGATSEVKATGTGTTVDPYKVEHPVYGAIAHDGVSSNPPVVGAGVSKTDSAIVSAGGDVTNLSVTRSGAAIVHIGAAPEVEDYNFTSISTTTETTLIAAVASVKHVLQYIVLTNTYSIALTVTFRDSVAGTTRFTVRVPPGTTQQLDFEAGWAAAAVNTAWTVQTDAAGASMSIGVKSYRRAH